MSVVKEKFCFLMPYHILEGRGGGAEVQTWLIAKELARRGYHVCYVCQTVSGRSGKTEVIDGVRIYWLPYAHHFRWQMAPKYYAVLRDIAPDILITRVTGFLVGVAGQYAKCFSKTFVWMCADEFSGKKWACLSRFKYSKKQSKFNILQKIYGFSVAFLEDLIRIYGEKFVTYAFTQNNNQRRIYKQSFGRLSMRVFSGHEPPLKIVSNDQKIKDKIVLWVGNFGDNKRPEKFVELSKELLEDNYKLIMIGGHSDKKYVNRLLSDAPRNVQWLGKLSFNDTLGWFDKAFVFVNTSDYEGFPNTYIQSWLRGVPTFCLGADPDNLIVDNHLGETCLDISGLSAAIKVLAENPDKYFSLSTRVLRFAEENYTIQKAVDHFLKSIGCNENV